MDILYLLTLYYSMVWITEHNVVFVWCLGMNADDVTELGYERGKLHGIKCIYQSKY